MPGLDRPVQSDARDPGSPRDIRQGTGDRIWAEGKDWSYGPYEPGVRREWVSFDPFPVDRSTLGTDLRLAWPEVHNPLVSAHIRPASLQMDGSPAITRVKTGTAGVGAAASIRYVHQEALTSG